MCTFYEISLEVGFHMMFQKVFNVRCPSIPHFTLLSYTLLHLIRTNTVMLDHVPTSHSYSPLLLLLDL